MTLYRSQYPYILDIYVYPMVYDGKYYYAFIEFSCKYPDYYSISFRKQDEDYTTTSTSLTPSFSLYVVYLDV